MCFLELSSCCRVHSIYVRRYDISSTTKATWVSLVLSQTLRRRWNGSSITQSDSIPAPIQVHNFKGLAQCVICALLSSVRLCVICVFVCAYAHSCFAIDDSVCLWCSACIWPRVSVLFIVCLCVVPSTTYFIWVRVEAKCVAVVDSCCEIYLAWVNLCNRSWARLCHTGHASDNVCKGLLVQWACTWMERGRHHTSERCVRSATFGVYLCVCACVFYCVVLLTERILDLGVYDLL